MQSCPCCPTFEPVPFVEYAVVFQLVGFELLVKYVATVGIWVHFWIFKCIPLIYLPIFVPISCCYYHYFFVVELEIRDGDSPRSSFILDNSVLDPEFFVIPDEFENYSFDLCEELIRNFDGNYIESVEFL